MSGREAGRQIRQRDAHRLVEDFSAFRAAPVTRRHTSAGTSRALPRRMVANTVYVIESEADPRQFYIGLTSNLGQRLLAHNAGRSRHTSKYCPWRLIVAVDFAATDRAAEFERYLKSHSGRAFLNRHFR